MLASGGAYGDRTDMASIQGGAALQGMPQPPDGGGMAPGGPPPTPLDAASERPHEPLTAGMGSVPGVNPSAIDENTRERLIAALPTLAWLASQPKASEQTRQFVRQLKGDL